MNTLVIVALISLQIGVFFWSYSRSYKRGRQELKDTLRQWALDNAHECERLMAKRKGNNFGDQMYRASMKGNADAFLDMEEALLKIQ